MPGGTSAAPACSSRRRREGRAASPVVRNQTRRNTDAQTTTITRPRYAHTHTNIRAATTVCATRVLQVAPRNVVPVRQKCDHHLASTTQEHTRKQEIGAALGAMTSPAPRALPVPSAVPQSPDRAVRWPSLRWCAMETDPADFTIPQSTRGQRTKFCRHTSHDNAWEECAVGVTWGSATGAHRVARLGRSVRVRGGAAGNPAQEGAHPLAQSCDLCLIALHQLNRHRGHLALASRDPPTNKHTRKRRVTRGDKAVPPTVCVEQTGGAVQQVLRVRRGEVRCGRRACVS